VTQLMSKSKPLYTTKCIGYGGKTMTAKTQIKVKLVGNDGNAFAILGAVSKALRKGGRGDLVDAFMKEATSGDYNHLLRTACEYVEVE
jgi:hypothetical protein